ncbi:hypothetical protein [Caballeronia sp. GAWG2-1]|uniref:hypothetical protein n=1 Tax=Caballeronia sp. GAWG2-1 TaxID=2921744 RepID=UPI00202772A4|nr:hypothetical protein [Caballeronia sp. GAWG2-1]
MPDPAVKRHRHTFDTPADAVAPLTRPRRGRAAEASSADSADTEKKLARAVRSAQRLAQLSATQRCAGETLDLFAEDAERANLQALNTDIRQGTFEGFELPDVFLAAVQSNGALAVNKRMAPRSEAAPHPASVQDELLVVAEGDEIDAAPPTHAPGELAASIDSHSADIVAGSLSAALVDARIAHEDASFDPVLDRARVTAFTDTIDALRAVISEQRGSTAAHARRMKTLLTIIVCVTLLTVATGVVQTVVLMRMGRDTTLQQERMEQLMLNQQATLASLFDAHSETDASNGAASRETARALHSQRHTR